MITRKTREQLLDEITQALADNVITPTDLEQYSVTPHQQQTPQSTTNQTPATTPHKQKLTAVEVLFYIAGLILFAAIVSIIVQSGSDNVMGNFLISGGVGAILWVIAYVLYRQPMSAILSGLMNSLLLTGSLSLLLGGFILANEVTSGADSVQFIPAALVFLSVGLLHLAYDRIIKNSITLLLGILLLVTAFPVVCFTILQDLQAPVGAWSFVIILGSALLAATTRVISAMEPDRPGLKLAYDSLAAFVAMAAMYVASYGDGGIVWLIILIGSIIGLFYASILRRERPLLGSASVFLVITIITIAFRYFSSFGTSFSLIIAAAGLLGTAAIAATINKKYFDSSQQ